MKRLTWGSIVLCIFASASLAADPDAAGTSNSAGGASKGAVGTGGKISKFSGVVVTAGGLAVLTAAVIAASAGSGNGATTTNH